MWRKWIPWRYLLKKVARAQGFVDPIKVIAKLQRFSQPSEVAAPVELLRLSAVLHARGLMNSQAIQHNLDWVWPFWVHQQFDPNNKSFVPRAFSITHINLTHRNWTAVGIPGSSHYPIVDPRGLVTPFYDGWSLDAWVVNDAGEQLVPSKEQSADQLYTTAGNLAVETDVSAKGMRVRSRVEVVEVHGVPVCRIEYKAESEGAGWLAVSLRPCNPEGIAEIGCIQKIENHGWKVNDKNRLVFDEPFDRHRFSKYRDGDVFWKLPEPDGKKEIRCDVEMATAAGLFRIEAGKERAVRVQILLEKMKTLPGFDEVLERSDAWDRAVDGTCRMEVPDTQFQYLYDTAVRTMILHSPDEIYPGPYTYKHFWFRDAAIILNAMLCTGLTERSREVLETFPSRQGVTGYFRSQEGEWDSNGQVLWIIQRYCELTGKKLPDEVYKSAMRGAQWIKRKRLPGGKGTAHDGLFPPGFSAEHLGPNDYYYWDDFWGVEGFRAAASLSKIYGNESAAEEYGSLGADFMDAVESSLKKAAARLGHEAMPAAPLRRMDTGAIGSLPVDYPLKLWAAGDSRSVATARYLFDNCFVEGGFFHDMSHSGINPYLTLHIAQVFLRAGDLRYFDIVKNLANLATSTGQWPEAVHPQTRGGCMGDGQHVWASAEWVLMMRSFFLREEGDKLILFPGIPQDWLESGKPILFGPAPTRFGKIELVIAPKDGSSVKLSWTAQWRNEEPPLEVMLPGRTAVEVLPGTTHLQVNVS